MNISKYNTVSYRFVIVFTAILTGSIQAASITWDGSTDGNWNTGTNWVGDAAPVDTDDLIFTGTASTTTNNDIAANTDFAGIQLTNTTAGQSFTLGGNTIDLTGDIVSTAAGGTIDDTISLGVNLSGAARIINLGANHNLTVSGVISDDTSRDLQMIGSGTLTLSAANTYNRLVIGDFGTRTNGGTVVVENDTAIGGGQLLFEHGGTLKLGTTGLTIANTAFVPNWGGTTRTVELDEAGTNTGTLSGSWELRYGGGLDFNVGADDTLTMSGNFTTGAGGNNSIRKAGAGTLVLSGSNTTNHNLAINAGTVTLGSGGTGGTLRIGETITISSGATFAVNQSDTVTQGTDFSTAAITGAGILRAFGDGTTVLNVANTHTGGTKMGQLGVAGDSATRAIDIRHNSALGTGAMTFEQGGILELGSDGLSVSNSLFLPNWSAGTRTIKLDVAGTNTGTLSGNVDLRLDGAGEFVVDVGTDDTLTFSGVISNVAGGNAGIVKNSNGTLVLSGNNSYNGGNTINAGVVSMQHVNALGNTTGTTTVASGAALEVIGGLTTAAEKLTLNGTGISIGGALRSISGNNTYAGEITLGAASRINSDTGTLTLNHATAINDTQDLTFGGAGDITVDTALQTGTGSVTKDGIGTLIFNGTNTYTGTTTVSAGTLQAGSTSAFGSLSAVTVTGTLKLDGNSNTIGSLAGAGTVENDNASAATLTAGDDDSSTTFSGLMQNGAAGGTFKLIKSGTGTMTITGANTHTGGTTISQGNVTITNNEALGTGTVGLQSLTGGNTPTLEFGADALDLSENILVQNSSGNKTIKLDLAGTNTGTHSGQIDIRRSAAGEFDIDVGADDTFNVTGSVYTGAGGGAGITKLGTGTLNISGNNSYSGTTAVSAGVLNIQHANALGNTGGVTTVASGAALQIQGDITTAAEALTLSGTGISTDGALRNISGTNTYAGAITLGADTQINSDAGTLTLNHATAINESFNLTFDGAGDTTVSTAIQTGAKKLIKKGAGTLTLSATNTYTGFTEINAGTVIITNSQALGTGTTKMGVANGGPQTLSFGADSLDLSEGIRVTNNTGNKTLKLDLAGTNTGTLSGALDIRHSVAGEMDIDVGTDDTFNITGTVTYAGSGLAGLTKIGAGTLNLSGNNNYLGDTTVSAGVLNIQHANALGGTAQATTVTSGAALQIQGDITTAAEALTLSGSGISTDGALRNISGTNTYAGEVTLGAASRINSDAGTLTLNHATAINESFNLTFDGAGDITVSTSLETGAGTLTKDGTGTLSLSGTNTYTGDTTIGAGTLSVTGAGSLGSGTYAGAIANSSTLTFDTSADQTLSGVISGTGALNKSSTGTLTLSNTNTYNGLTTVTAGTLALTGSIGGGLTINGGIVTTDADGGSVGGALRMTTGSISPGTRTSNGTLNIAGNSTWTGGTYVWSVSGGMGDKGTDADSNGYNDALGTVGTDWDYMEFTGTLDLAGASITIEIDSNGTYTGYDWDKATEVKIVGASSIDNFSASFFTLDTSGFDDATGAWWVGWSIASHDNALWLQYKAVPEPGTYVMIFGLFALPFCRWLGKRRKNNVNK